MLGVCNQEVREKIPLYIQTGGIQDGFQLAIKVCMYALAYSLQRTHLHHGHHKAAQRQVGWHKILLFLHVVSSFSLHVQLTFRVLDDSFFPSQHIKVVGWAPISAPEVSIQY